MSLHSPDQYRIRNGRAASSRERHGNSGAFAVPLVIKGRKQIARVICGDPEVWLPIQGYEGLYEVSNCGRVRALYREVEVPFGGMRVHEPHLVAVETMDKGYLRVTLCRDGVRDKRLIHVLVAEAFIPERGGNADQVNHRDGNHGNPNVMNLEWCTGAYNTHHAIENGLRSGLTAAQIREIQGLLASGLSREEVADAVDRSPKTIKSIALGYHRPLDPETPWPYQGMPLWEHVSVSYADRIPCWETMCQIKDLFWSPEDCVVQYHPPHSEYVNCHPNVLHLWRPLGADLPRPPTWMV